MMRKLNVAEFYSGIGGMHYALQYAGIEVNIVTAFEISTTANTVYKHNFPSAKVSQSNIEALTVTDLEKLNVDVWTMSPPCQPFTRQGKQGASNDPRSKSFLNIMNILSEMKTPPTYILMENVKGFECSDTHQRFREVLELQNYTVQELLLSPTDFGIPNSRTRYYLTAKQKPRQFAFKCSISPYQNSTDTFDRTIIECKEPGTHENCVCQHLKIVLGSYQPKKISDFLQKNDNFPEFMLQKNVLLRYFPVLDIVDMDSTQSCCFTKAYSKYFQGTGSVLTSQSIVSVQDTNQSLEDDMLDEMKYENLAKLKLRFFTPKEISCLMCFPDHFDFPAGITPKQKYMLLGNSVNVLVVGNVLKWFLFDDL